MSKKSINTIRSPKQNRSKETVNYILEATAQILIKSGEVSCTTNAIAEKAGISIGGLYQYFANRDAILRALCLRERQKDLTAVHLAFERCAERSLEEIIHHLLVVAYERYSDQPRLRQILQHEIPQKYTKQTMRAMREELAQALHDKVMTYPEYELPKNFKTRILIIMSGVEASFHTAIEELKMTLNQKELILQSESLILHFLNSYRVR